MSRRNFAVFVLAILLASSALAAAEVQLTALTLQAGKTFEIKFAKTSRAPSRASMQGTLLYDNGQASVKLSYRKMEPAVLFAGDISAYVLWAVTADGSAENLGEVVADKKSASGSLQGYTGKKTFALMVTAEPFATVTRPTEIVVFVSGEIRRMNVQNTPFSFTDFTTDYKPAFDSISGFQYKDNMPVAVKQANKAIEIAEKLDAAAVNPMAMDGAKLALGKAIAAAGNKKSRAGQARIAAQLASQAINDTILANEAKVAAGFEAMRVEAERLAERAALERRVTSAEGEYQRMAQELKEVQIQREALDSETKNLALLMEKLTAEKDAIAADRDALKAELDKIVAGLEAIKAEPKAAAEAVAMQLEEKAVPGQGAITAEGEYQRMAQELKEVQIQREALASETKSLARLTEKLTAEKEAIAADRDAVRAERDNAAAEAEAKRLAERAALEQRTIAAEGESQRMALELREVQAQREALADETKNLALLTEKLTAEKEAIAADRDAVKAERDKVAAEREAMKAEAKAAAEAEKRSAEKDAIAADRDAVKAEWNKVAAEREAMNAEVRRLAERAALEQRATTAEGESQRIARELREVQVQREALASETKNLASLTEKLTAEKDVIAAERDAVKAERDKVAADREAIKAEAKAAAEAQKRSAEMDAAAERDAVMAERDRISAEKERDKLAGMLREALSSVAETTETARGVIVSLSGLFDVGKTTLKPASHLSVAKLAGIIMVFTNMNLSIEGYTDSSGSRDLNMRLSAARASSVYEFLKGQGISDSRMKYEGLGPDNPVAPNDTEANRAKNRRIEIVLTQAVR